MALTITVRQGGGTAAVRDYTDQIPVWSPDSEPLMDAGMMCQNGSSSQYQFLVDDDANEIPTLATAQLAAHNEVKVIEDGPGYDAWLSWGRIASKTVGRGNLLTTNPVQWQVTVDDGNSDLKGLALTSPWVRSAESGRARALALVSAFLNGSPRVTTVIQTHLVASGGEVTMPAKTYPAGTHMAEILDDCAQVEGKVYSLVVHHQSSASHKCLLYIDEADHSTYASTLSITDNSPNLTTSYPPIWDQGPAAIHEGQEQVSGIVSTWGAGTASYVFAESASHVDRYDYWVESYNDNLSVSAAQALIRADSVRAVHGDEHVTHQVTIKLTADKVDLLCAGMSINIRAAASMGGQYLGTSQTRRIAQLKWEPIAPEVGAVKGHYYAHMQLDRPVRVLAERSPAPGPKPPSGGNTASCTLDVGQMTEISTPNGGFETGLTTYWTFGQISGGVQGPATGDWEGSYYYQINGAGFIRIDPWTGVTFTAGQTYVVRFRHANSTSVAHFGVAGGDEVTQAAASDTAWVQDCIEWIPASTVAGAGVHFGIAPTGGLDSFDLDDVRLYTGGSGTQPGPVVGTGEGSSGNDTGHYADAEHSHEHALITTGGPYHEAADVTFTPTGTIAATNVQAAIAEVAAEATTDHGALTGLADDDHTQYLLATKGEHGKVQAHGAMGATETFDPANGNLHTGTLDANCTFTLTSPSATRGGSPAYSIIELAITGSGTNTWTWPGSVVWAGGSAPAAPGNTELVRVLLETWDGGTTWYGVAVGGGSSVGALDDLSDVTITTPTTADRLRYTGSVCVNSSLKWIPVTTYDGTNWLPAVDGDGNAIVTEA